MQLDIGASNFHHVIGIELGFEMEKMAEQAKMGLDAQKHFTEVDKNRNIENEIRIIMMGLNPLVEKKALKEI